TETGRTALLPEPPREPRRQPPRAASATHVVLSRYGAEVRSFLSARTATRMSMEEVFSVFSEDVWKGLQSVREQRQMRSWLYVVARNALARHVRRKQRWRSRHVSAELDELSGDARRSIATRLGDLSILEPIIAELDDADRSLLEQRLLHALPWREIALANASSSERQPASEADLERECARLRKRFQLLMQSLRARLPRPSRL
ncbi:MAG TPA: sigma factor, partial [Polyangiales bacterium]|nr:sigma factor [Polyangiales bacterium]